MEENRVENGIREWRGHMKRLSDLFDESFVKHPNIQKAQLQHFREVVKRPLPNITRDEKMMLGVLKGEIRKMEKALYPSRLVRLMRRIARVLTVKERKPREAPSAAHLVIQPKPAFKRDVPPVRRADKKQKVQHDLLPKKQTRNSRGLKR